MLPSDFPSDADSPSFALLVFLAKHWREEMTVITGAPVISILTLLLLLFFIWLGFRLYYKRELAQIPYLKEGIKEKGEEIAKIGEKLRIQHEKVEATQKTNMGLQTELAAIKDTQPRLTATAFPYRCELTYQQQPRPKSGSEKIFNGGRGFFIFLRVTNQPKSTNTHAVAQNLYATVQYYDEHGKELALFPSAEGAWVSLDQKTGTIEHIEHYPHYSLHPQEYRYLAIALRYPWGKSPDRYALNVMNLHQPDWVDVALRLPTETTIVKVILGCNRFRSEQLYTLKDLGSEKGLHMEPKP